MSGLNAASGPYTFSLDITRRTFIYKTSAGPGSPSTPVGYVNVDGSSIDLTAGNARSYVAGSDQFLTGQALVMDKNRRLIVNGGYLRGDYDQSDTLSVRACVLRISSISVLLQWRASVERARSLCVAACSPFARGCLQ